MASAQFLANSVSALIVPTVETLARMNANLMSLPATACQSIVLCQYEMSIPFTIAAPPQASFRQFPVVGPLPPPGAVGEPSGSQHPPWPSGHVRSDLCTE